jgi:hypothetical protein
MLRKLYAFCVSSLRGQKIRDGNQSSKESKFESSLSKMLQKLGFFCVSGLRAQKLNDGSEVRLGHFIPYLIGKFPYFIIRFYYSAIR